MFGNLGSTEILLIALVILLLFGAKRLPDIAKGIGKSIKDFKKEISSITDNITTDNSKKHNNP